MIRIFSTILFILIYLSPAAQNLKAIYEGGTRTYVDPYSCTTVPNCDDNDPLSQDFCLNGLCAHKYVDGVANNQIFTMDMKANGDLVYITEKSVGIYNANQHQILTPMSSGLASNWYFLRYLEPELAPNGILWIPCSIYTGSTPEYGLMSWDGMSVDTFASNNFFNSNLLDIESYPNGDVVLLFANETLVNFDGQNWTSTSLNNYPSLNGMHIGSIEIDPAGDLWLGGTSSTNKVQFAHFDGSTWTTHLSTITHYGGSRSFMIASNGDKWSSSSANRITHFDGTNWTQYHASSLSNLPSGHGNIIKEGPNNRVWISMNNGGLVELDPSNGGYNLYDAQNTAYPFNYTGQIAAHPNFNQQYLSTYTEKGLGSFDGTNWSFITPEEGPADEFYRGFLDLEADGQIWYRGQFNEVNCYFDGTAWHNLPLTEEVLALEVDQSGGIWLVTTDPAAFLKYYDGNTITNISTPNGLYALYSLGIDANGDLWGHNYDAIWRFDGSSWTEFSNSAGNFSCGSSWGSIIDLIVGSNGTVWVGCGAGEIFSFDGTTWNLSYNANTYVRDILATNQGDIWTSTANELRRDGPSGTLVFDNNNSPWQSVIKHRLTQDQQGDIWGFSDQNQEIIHFASPNPTTYSMGGLGFQMDTTTHIAFDLNGDLWVSNVTGVAHFSFQTTPIDTVWPGDANDDLIANNMDYLALGQAFGSSGPARPNASLNWQAEPVSSWSNTLPSGVNYAHTDTDGSGTVDLDDTLAVTLNYGLTHNKSGGVELFGATPLLIIPDLSSYLPGDTVDAPIILGVDTLVADSVYGIAFTINYDPALIDSASLQIDFSNSWLGNKNQDMITLDRDDFSNGQVDLALSRTDQTERTGFGQIAKIRVVMIDDISGKDLIRDTLRLEITNVRLIRLDDTDIPYDTEIAEVVLTQEVTALADFESDFWTVYPNPAQDQIVIKAKRSAKRQTKLTLYNSQGQIVFKSSIPSGEQQIELPALPNALYLLQLQNEEGLYQQKLQIRR
ncbi:MAG: T9SS type A sorting domain-containing protein [Bacteroidia bacterium]